jgi:hypothetical protein
METTKDELQSSNDSGKSSPDSSQKVALQLPSNVADSSSAQSPRKSKNLHSDRSPSPRIRTPSQGNKSNPTTPRGTKNIIHSSNAKSDAKLGEETAASTLSSFSHQLADAAKHTYEFLMGPDRVSKDVRFFTFLDIEVKLTLALGPELRRFQPRQIDCTPPLFAPKPF